MWHAVADPGSGSEQDPSSVHPSWGVYFAGMDKGLRSEDAFRPPPGLVSLSNDIEGSAPFLDLTLGGSPTNVEDHMKVRRRDRRGQRP